MMALAIIVLVLARAPVGGESSGYTLTVEEFANDIIPGQVTYRWYVDLANGDDFLSSVYGNDGDPMEMGTENGFYNDPLGASLATGINPAFVAFFPTIGGDSWITIGLDGQNTGDEVAISVVEDSNQPFVAAFQSGSAIDGQDILLNTQTGRSLVRIERHTERIAGCGWPRLGDADDDFRWFFWNHECSDIRQWHWRQRHT